MPTSSPLPPTHQRTLEVIGLVKAQPDLLPEAVAALAHAGDTKAEAGQAGGAVLQVEMAIGTGPCWAAWEWAVAGHQPAGSPSSTPCRVPTSPPPAGHTSLWNKLQDTIRNAEHHASGIHGLTGVSTLVCFLHVTNGQRATASLTGHCHPAGPQDTGGVRPGPLTQPPLLSQSYPGLGPYLG